MATYIPAFRARMGDVEYFVSIVTLGEAARLVNFVEDVDGWTSETPPELKLQRKLNIQRVERELVPYLIDNDDHFYSALTVEVRPPFLDGESGELPFEARDAFPGGVAYGVLTLDGTEMLYALDGQHRLKSIELAIRERPQLAREHITLILIPYRSTVRSQTLFSDLNRFAKNTSKSISLLFTHREGLARVAKGVAAEVDLLRDRMNMESTSLSANAKQFMTLSTLYEMCRSLAPAVGGEDLPEAELTARIAEIVTVIGDNVAPWRQVAADQEHPAYLRQRHLVMHGVGQQAVAIAAARSIQQRPDDWRIALGGLQDIDWRLTNPAWQGVAVHGGRVYNTASSVRDLANVVSRMLGLDETVEPATGPASVPRKTRR